MLRTREGRRRPNFLAVEMMERRELLSGSPVLFTSGALASRPTEWGIIPSSSSGELASYFHANFSATKDISGKPIDFNKDGLTDLVMGGGTAETVGYSPGDEITASSRQGFAEAYLADPNGGFKVIPGPNTNGGVKAWDWSHFAVLDMNGDGSQDILKLSADSKISLYLYDAAGNTFLKVPDVSILNHPAFTGSSNLSMGDVNGDGLPDLAVPDYDSSQQLTGFSLFLAQAPPPGGTWDGQFVPDAVSTVTLRESIPILNNDLGSDGPGNVQPILADFNGDGKLDMVIPEQKGLTFFTNPGDGKFTSGNSTFVGSIGSVLGFNLQAADFNNDGKTDLISTPNPVSVNMKTIIPPNIPSWGGVFAPVSVYLNTTPTSGLLAFNVVASGPTDEFLGFLQAGDFNLDGNMDIGVAFASQAGTTFAVGTGDGLGGFDTYKIYVAYTNTADGVYDTWPRTIVSFGVGQFNRDAQLDIAATASLVDNENRAVSITGASYNKTFAQPGATPQNPPPAVVGQPYSLQLAPTGGDSTKPYAFTLDPQSVPLPAGLTLSSLGLISGTPTQSGPFQLLVDVAQPNGLMGRSFVYLVLDPASQAIVSPGALPNAVAGLPFNQQLSTTAGPATWAVTFGRLPEGLTLSPGGLISGTPLAIGTFNFQVTGTGSGFQSSINYALTVQSMAAPVVTTLRRYGYHNQPTILVLAFSQPMDAASASNLANYVLTTAGPDGRIGTRDDKRIPLASALFHATANTVTLSTTQKSLPLNRLYQLQVIGSPAVGLRSATGTYLGGQGVGAPGTNYVQVFGKEILAGPKTLMKSSQKRRAK